MSQELSQETMQQDVEEGEIDLIVPDEIDVEDVLAMEATNEVGKKRVSSDKKPRAKKARLTTSDPNIVVEISSRKPGPNKKVVTVYKEDIPQQEIVIVEKTRTLGRPPKAIKEKVPTLRDIKKMEAQEQFNTAQLAAQRDLRQTRKGKVDLRCIQQRTPKQQASIKALLERNLLLRKMKQQQDQKDVVKEVVGELSKLAKTMAPTAPAPAPELLYNSHGRLIR